MNNDERKWTRQYTIKNFRITAATFYTLFHNAIFEVKLFGYKTDRLCGKGVLNRTFKLHIFPKKDLMIAVGEFYCPSAVAPLARALCHAESRVFSLPEFFPPVIFDT